jgi:formamidopyrimidine-DNA glycosylase
LLEIPEAFTLANQLNETVRGKTVACAAANQSPHKFTWYFGDPEDYPQKLGGRSIDGADAQGGNVELRLGDMRLLLQDGVNLRFLAAGESVPKKHQLCLRFEDDSLLCATVSMYGGIAAFREGENDNPYYLVAKEKPSPLGDGFDAAYFESLCSGYASFSKLSAKAFLATEQRIPGLGNGVLQDLLWRAKIHPKRKMGSLSDQELSGLYRSIKQTLAAMAEGGGRDTERDLFGRQGGYRTVLSRNTYALPCPVCGGALYKEAYLGGSIYYCALCQGL